jgi:hypothetical protein
VIPHRLFAILIADRSCLRDSDSGSLTPSVILERQ